MRADVEEGNKLISYTKLTCAAKKRGGEEKKKYESEAGPGGRPGGDDPFPRRSSPTSNWSSDPWS